MDEEEKSSPVNAGMIRTPSYAMATQNEANEVTEKILKNGINKSNGDGSASPCSSTTEEDDDTKSSCSSGKDSGVGKTAYDSSDASSSSRRNSVGSRLKKLRYVSRESSPGLSSSSSIGKLQSVSQADLQSNSSLLWGASLLYHTGIPTPKVKVNHFPEIKPHSEPSKIKQAASSTSVFSSLRSRSTSKLFHSALSLRSSEDVTKMDDPYQRKSSWRFGGSSKKLHTPPHHPQLKASHSVDSSGGQSSSAMRPMATPDSGFMSSGYGSGGAFATVSPVRNRHASCISSTPKSSNPTGMLGARGKVRNSQSSLRLLKSATSKTSPYMENSTNSLPRGKSEIPNEAEEATTRELSIRQQSATLPTAIPSSASSSSSSSGFKSAKKALRNSFKAAKSFLPIPSSKIGPSVVSEKGSLKSGREKLSFSPSPLSDDEAPSSTNATSSALNSSAPNTPVVVKKSRLERARKRFASTLSLHTGGGSNSTSSSNNGSNTIGGYPSRSKSTSTLVISDSEHVPSARIPTGVATYSHQQQRFSYHLPNPATKLGSLDMLAVVEGDQITGDDGKSKIKGDTGSRSKSPFRFMSKSKTSKEKKIESAPLGFEIAPAPHNPQEVGIESLGSERDSVVRPLSPEANAEFPSKSTQPKNATAEKEKPTKKRLSFMKTLVDKTMRRGSSGSKKGDVVEESEIGSKSEEKKESGSFHRAMGSAGSDTETSRTRRRSTSRERRQPEENPEIVTFDNEPKVRRKRSQQEESQEIVSLDSEPKVRSGRSRLNSGSGLGESTESSTISSTPPAAPSSERPFSPCEQDREIHELVVSETSIDISPGKVPETVQQNLSHFNATNTSDHYDRQDCQNESSCGVNETQNVFKREKSGFFGGNPLDHAGSVTTQGIDSQPGSATKQGIDGHTGSVESQGIDTTNRVFNKKTKSPSFMRRIISLSPSSSFVIDKSMEDGIKKKKKGSKKSSKKLPLETTDAELSAPQYQSLSTSEGQETQIGSSFQSESTPQQNSDSGISHDNNNSVASGRRRKSSEDFKELRKNAIHSNGKSPIAHDDNINKGTNEPAMNQTETTPKAKEASEDREDDEMFDEEDKSGDNNEVDETDDPETGCTESFRQLKPFNYDLEPVEEGKKERLYKVLVVGELGAGKTSIIKRYVHQFFSQHYRATIGVDFALKVLRWDPDTVVRLQLWDIAGQERFGSMTRVYYKEAVGAFVVFDVTRSATLEAVPKWKADLDAKVALPDGRPIPTVLLANKSDQPKEGIAANREKMNDFCQQQGFSAWFETSAKDNINIDESANFLVSKILEMDKWSQEPIVADPDKVELTANGKHKGSPSSNCAC